MSGDPTAWLSTLPTWAFAFTLVLARCAGATLLLPGFGEGVYPSIIRAELALGVTLLMVPIIEPLVPRVPNPGLESACMIGAELITGLWLGWLARMVYLALPMSAQLIAYLLGTSSVLQATPELGAENTALAGLFQLLAPLTVLVSGLYALPLMGLADSYDLIPPGTLLPAVYDSNAAVRAVAQGFALALRLASPFVVTSIVWHVVMGCVSRMVPRLQVYFIAVPGQIVVGMVLLASVTGVLLAVWQDALRASWTALPAR